MDEAKSPTPEKQLLDLIEKPKPEVIEKSQRERGTLSLFSFGVMQGRLSSWAKRLNKIFLAKKDTLELKNLNTLLKVIIFFLFVYLVTVLSLNVQRLKKTEFISGAAKAKSLFTIAPAVDASELYPKKDIAYYTDEAKIRNIFKFAASAVTSQDGAKLSEIAQLTEGLKLVGISFAEYPEAMIESEKEKKTYFLKVGDSINNKVKIQKILKNQVVLEYLGEKKVLR